MPQRDASAFLADIVAACDATANHVDGADYAEYLRNDMLRHAVERCLFIMGEAVNQIRKLEPLEVYALGDVDGIVDVRNILAHGYFKVKHDLAWDMATKDVPKLRLAAQEWLDSLQ